MVLGGKKPFKGKLLFFVLERKKVHTEIVITLSWTPIMPRYNLTGTLFSFNEKRHVLSVSSLFFTWPFADQAHFCQFRKTGLNMWTEISIPPVSLCSSRAASACDLAQHVPAAHCSTCFQVFFRDQKVEKLVLLFQMCYSKPQRTSGCRSFGKSSPERFLMEAFLRLVLWVIQSLDFRLYLHPDGKILNLASLLRNRLWSSEGSRNSFWIQWMNRDDYSTVFVTLFISTEAQKFISDNLEVFLNTSQWQAQPSLRTDYVSLA